MALILSGGLLYLHRLETAVKDNIKALMTTLERLVLYTTM
nr:MAG TPA: hypothetical protein [Caudoviricetes sp.]